MKNTIFLIINRDLWRIKITVTGGLKPWDIIINTWRTLVLINKSQGVLNFNWMLLSNLWKQLSKLCFSECNNQWEEKKNYLKHEQFLSLFNIWKCSSNCFSMLKFLTLKFLMISHSSCCQNTYLNTFHSHTEAWVGRKTQEIIIY